MFTSDDFDELLDTPAGFVSQLEELRNDTGSSIVAKPSGVMWTDISISDAEESYGVSESGLVYDDDFSGIIDVDDIVDEDEDYDGISDPSEELN